MTGEGTAGLIRVPATDKAFGKAVTRNPAVTRLNFPYPGFTVHRVMLVVTGQGHPGGKPRPADIFRRKTMTVWGVGQERVSLRRLDGASCRHTPIPHRVCKLLVSILIFLK